VSEPRGAETPGRSDHLRRIDGEDIVFHSGDGFRWVELDEGYRVHFHRVRGSWQATRAGSNSRIATGRTLADVYRLVRRHYRALA